MPLTLANFIKYYHIPLKNIYKNYSFSRLCAEAGVIEDFEELLEEAITKCLSKIVAIDSRRWITFLVENLRGISADKIRDMNGFEKRMMNMFYVTVWNKTADWESAETAQNLQALNDSPTMLNEIIELLEYNLDRIDFVDQKWDLGFECPLDVYCTYTRDQLLVALDHSNPSNVREGVKWLEDKKTDVFMITLDKSEKDYSPSTMYEDYSVNKDIFHWQSQSTTSDTSPTGQRYIHHREMGSRVLLFVREKKKDELGTSPYTFLGEVSYIDHTGSRPMSINWHMELPIPAKFLKRTNKLVVG